MEWLISGFLGAFGAHPDHDAHLLPTLSAIQILVTHNALDRVDVDRVTKCKLLFIRTVTYSNSRMRFDSHRVASAPFRDIRRRLARRSRHAIPLLRSQRALAPRKAASHERRQGRGVHRALCQLRRRVWRRRGCRESRRTRYVRRLSSSIIPAHLYVRVVFVCVAALAILGRLDIINQSTLPWWLAERQLPNGGLNGRPEKLEDVRFPRTAQKRDHDLNNIIGLLQLLGLVRLVDSEETLMDRLLEAREIHPVR